MTGMGRHKAKERDYHKTDEVLINGVLRCHVVWNKVRMTSCQVTDPMPYSLFNCNICFIHMVPNVRGTVEKNVKVTRMFSEPHHEPSVLARGHRAQWGLAG